jgi:hypothetical protein
MAQLQNQNWNKKTWIVKISWSCRWLFCEKYLTRTLMDYSVVNGWTRDMTNTSPLNCPTYHENLSLWLVFWGRGKEFVVEWLFLQFSSSDDWSPLEHLVIQDQRRSCHLFCSLFSNLGLQKPDCLCSLHTPTLILVFLAVSFLYVFLC